MLIAVRAEVENVTHWRKQFKTDDELFKSHGVTVVYIGASENNKVISVFNTDILDEFIKIFNDPVTSEAMANDKITGGVELHVLDETYNL